MALLTKNDSTSKLQTELARLENRKAALAGKLVAAQSAEAAAKEAQRRFFVETENLDASDSARLSAAVASAVSEVAAVTDAIATVDQLIEEGHAAIVAAKESAARAKRAAEIEAKAKKLEPMIATAESLFDKLADVLTRIVDTAEDRDLVLREYSAIKGPGSPLPAINLVSAALAEALFKSLPDGFTVTMSPTRTFAAASLPLMIRRDGGLSGDLPLDTDDGQGFRPLPLSGALSANLVDPLRTAASEILAGERPLATARAEIEDADEDGDGEPAFGWRRLVLTKPIKWRDWRGENVTTPDADATIPAPVADAAIAAGIAFEHSSREAEHHLNNRYERGFHNSATLMNKEAVELNIRWPATTRAAA